MCLGVALKIPAVLAISISILLLCSVWLVYINRASEKIVSSTLPIAIGAILGIGISVFVFGSDPPKRVRFESTFVVDRLSTTPDKSIQGCRGGTYISDNEITEITKQVRLKNEGIARGIHVYNHLLQWKMLTELAFAYRRSWQADYFASPRYRFQQIFSRPADPSITKEMVDSTKGNMFGGNNSVLEGETFQISLPPRSSIAVSAPSIKDAWADSEGSITIEIDRVPLLGPLYTVRIYNRPTIILDGTQGYRRYISSLSQNSEAQLQTYIYEVRVETETSKWRSGSPSLAAFKGWAEQLTEVLRNDFDEQRLFDRVRNDGCADQN
jgi:hypothetical protein